MTLVVVVPMLDLQKHHKLFRLELREMTVKRYFATKRTGFGSQGTNLDNLTLYLHNLKQYCKSLSSSHWLRELELTRLLRSDTICFSCLKVMILQNLQS